MGGAGGAGGAGGFRGGNGGNVGDAPSLGAPGAGPSGGKAGPANSCGTGGTLTVSNSKLIPLIGGSGGSGGSPPSTPAQTGARHGGGGGGGAILIASNGTITVNGQIYARGGSGNNSSAGGSGGAVRLVASAINGGGGIHVFGGTTSPASCNGGNGYVRLEAINNTYNLAAIQGASGTSVTTIPGPARPTNIGTLKIVSLGSITAPANTGGLTSPVDINFTSTQSGPLTLTVSSSNIPIGTPFTVRVAPVATESTNSGDAFTYTGTISGGTTQAGTGSVSFPLPVGTSIITVSASFILPPQQQALLERAVGEKVARMEVGTDAQGRSQNFLVTASGKRLAAAPFAHLLATP